jgi:hypothetical protein
VRRLLRGEGQYVGVRSDLMRRAEAVAEAAGPGMEADLFIEEGRARVGVVTATAQAMVSEARDRSLTRAIDAAR